ncbi:MAG: GNAT family N-acetyltransferase [Polaribacter sp.]
MKLNYKIRFAKPKDIHQIINLCEAHARYERCDFLRKNKATQLSNGLFSETPKLYCLVVETEDELVGYASYTIQYSIWDACEYIYMDCLYLKETARNQNIGEQLINTIKKEGKKLGYNLMQWQAPDFNIKGIKFYRRIGATSKKKERFFLEIN